MIGDTILHYKILEKLGEGGMGVVYLAQDTKLERKVAIKFLPHHISANSEERERFKIEARAAAALNHHNITQIYSIEEADNEMFIVMEYVEGKELKDIINPPSSTLSKRGDTGGLAMNDIINYATQIAEGLEAAHKKGIIHRDIKSSNIMITEDGKVKIMDFGLAKVKGGIELTKVGTTVGTTTYMSPEQAKGKEVDHRTDIWSFGVVFYELITGKLPFEGEYDQAITYSVINEKQKPVSFFRNDLPTEIEQIVNKTLEKDLEKRFNDFSEILSLLKNIQVSRKINDSTTPKHNRFFGKKSAAIISAIFIVLLIAFVLWKAFSPPKKNITETKNKIERIAILPFNNIKNDPKTNFLGFALADQIISSLAYVKNIVVRPASSIRQYQNENVTPIKAGNQLKVDYILDGSYLKDNDIIRLNLELVNVHNNQIAWKNDFDVKYVNTFKLQDLVSRKVTSGLKVKFAVNKIHKAIPGNSKVYEDYLKAVSYPHTMEGTQQAISILNKAIKVDSTYAPAYSQLGSRYDYVANYSVKGSGNKKAAEKAFLKALSINNNLLSALNGLSRLYNENGKQLQAAKLLMRALKINPNNADAHFSLGYIFRYTGPLDKSLKEMQKAVELDPNNPIFQSIGITYLYTQKYQDALKVFEKSENNAFDLGWEGEIFLRLKNIKSAEQSLKKAIEIEPGGVLGDFSKAQLQYVKGNKRKSLDILKSMDESVEKAGIYDGEMYYNIANYFGLLGDAKDCVRLLKIAINHGFFDYQVMLNDTFLNPVRDDPEFKETLQQAKLKSDNFKDELIDNSLL